MSIVVQKYGGSSVADVTRLRQVAERVMRTRAAGHDVVVVVSAMGDSNLHNHKRCPLFLAGRAGGRLKGGLHLRAADGTPMANVMLSALHMLGHDDLRQFGDSSGEFDLTSVPAAATNP